MIRRSFFRALAAGVATLCVTPVKAAGVMIGKPKIWRGRHARSQITIQPMHRIDAGSQIEIIVNGKAITGDTATIARKAFAMGQPVVYDPVSDTFRAGP